MPPSEIPSVRGAMGAAWSRVLDGGDLDDVAVLPVVLSAGMCTYEQFRPRRRQFPHTGWFSSHFTRLVLHFEQPCLDFLCPTLATRPFTLSV